MKISNFIKNLFIIIIMLVLCSIIFTNITMYIQKNILKEEHPNILGFSTAVVISGSMSPTIETNDMIIIKEQNQYNINDIVAFNNGNSVVTHRIIREENNNFITKGDANNVEDQDYVTQNMILGKVIFIIPKLGNIIEYLQSPLGLSLIAIFAFIIIIIPTKKKEDKIKDSM